MISGALAGQEPLTRRQADIFRFVVQQLELGLPPTVREIAGYFGIKSTNAVMDHLCCLERKGYIMRPDGRSRGLFVCTTEAHVATAKQSASNRDHKRFSPSEIRKRATRRDAQTKARNAIKTGQLKRGCCVVCGQSPADAHHPNYHRPLNVIWLCSQHHRDHHRILAALGIDLFEEVE